MTEELDDPCAGGTHCCCCGPGEACCDCGKAQPPLSAWPAEPTPALSEILGTMCFEFIELSRLYREAGVEIPTRAEDEQAYFLHRYLTHWFAGGEDWRELMADEIGEKVEIVKRKRAEAEASAPR